MILRRWEMFGALLGIAVFAGCEENAAEKVQDEREDVIEAEQEVLEEHAELNQATQELHQERQEEGTAIDTGGPSLGDPSLTVPMAPDAAPAGNGGATDEAPNEGDPQAGTTEGAPGSTDSTEVEEGGSAEADSEDQGAGSGDLVPSAPE